MWCVGHVQAKDVDSCVHELANHRGGICGGSEGGNNFCPANSSSIHHRSIKRRRAIKSFLMSALYPLLSGMPNQTCHFDGEGHISRRTFN
jgi:hypothetical protein